MMGVIAAESCVCAEIYAPGGMFWKKNAAYHKVHQSPGGIPAGS